jgi:ribosomal protein L35
MKSHNLEKKSPKRKRDFARDQSVAKSDEKTVKKLLGLK